MAQKCHLSRVRVCACKCLTQTPRGRVAQMCHPSPPTKCLVQSCYSIRRRSNRPGDGWHIWPVPCQSVCFYMLDTNAQGSIVFCLRYIVFCICAHNMHAEIDFALSLFLTKLHVVVEKFAIFVVNMRHFVFNTHFSAKVWYCFCCTNVFLVVCYAHVCFQSVSFCFRNASFFLETCHFVFPVLSYGNAFFGVEHV